MKPTYVGEDVIMQGFETFIKQTPYFSIWNGQVMLGQWNEADREAGREWFEQTISAYSASCNTDTIIVKFHPELTGAYVTKQTPVIAAMLCKCYDSAGVGYAGNDMTRIPNNAYNAMMTKIMATIDERLGPVEDEPAGALDQIAGFLDRPGIAPIAQQIVPMLQPLIEKVTGLISAMIPVPPANGHAQTGTGNLRVAGVSGNEDKQQAENEDNAMTEDQQIEVINNALDRLQAHVNVVDVLPKLADYMDANPAMVPTLLTFIKAN